ncbi:hypothetical protein C8Q80DRAFT_1185892 [Daedaleopsis nitida]|nr:hypothetical protein C8Q80DRAFT_1185892 [Daedaleopsis nitida]
MHLVLISHTVYTYAVSNFGNVSALSVPTWSILAILGVTFVSDAVVQGIFCFRIWILSGYNQLLVLSNAFLSVVVLAEEIALSIMYSCENRYQELRSQEWLSTLILATGVATNDVYIALTLTRLLLKHQGNFRKTRRVVRTLVIYVVSTGALTSTCMLGSLIAFILADGTYLFIAFYFPLSKLAIISLLATLNIRRSLREHMDHCTITVESCA